MPEQGLTPELLTASLTSPLDTSSLVHLFRADNYKHEHCSSRRSRRIISKETVTQYTEQYAPSILGLRKQVKKIIK